MRPLLGRRQRGRIFLCAASMPLVAEAVFLRRERERMILRKLAEMRIATQWPPSTNMKVKMRKILEMINLLLRLVPQPNHQQNICFPS